MTKTISFSSLVRTCATSVCMFMLVMSLMFGTLTAQHASAQAVEDMNREQLIALILQLILQLQLQGGGSPLVAEPTDFDINEEADGSLEIGDRDQVIAEIEIPAVNEDRYLNELNFGFINTTGNDDPDESFTEVSLFIDGLQVYEADTDDLDWDSVSGDIRPREEVEVFNADDTGYGIYIPANQDLVAYVAVSVDDDAEEDQWIMYIPNDGISMYARSVGDVQVGDHDVDAVTFDIGERLSRDDVAYLDLLDVDEQLNENSDTTESDDTGQFTIEFEVTAEDEDVFISTQISNILTTSGDDDDVRYATYDSSGNVLGVSYLSIDTGFASLSSTADRDGNQFVVDEGESEEFTLTVIVDPVDAGFYSVGLAELPVEVDTGLVQVAFDADDFETDALYIPGTGVPRNGIQGTEDDEIRKDHLEEIADALYEYYEDNGTFKVNAGHSSNGNGWFNYEGGTYVRSVANVLEKAGYLDGDVSDPTGVKTWSGSKEQAGYMIISNVQTTDHKAGQAFTLWTNLDNPSTRDINTLDECLHDNYDGYSSRFPAAVRMNYCISGSASSVSGGGASIEVEFEDADVDVDDNEAEFEIEFEVTAADEDLRILYNSTSFLTAGSEWLRSPTYTGESRPDASVGYQILDENNRTVPFDNDRITASLDSTARAHDGSRGGYTVDEGETEEFTLTVTFEPSESGFYSAALTSPFVVDLGGELESIEIDEDDFETDSVFISVDGEGAGSGSGGGSSASNNTADDQQRKDDLEKIADALYEYAEDHDTLRVDEAGYKGFGVGWFNLGNSGVYQDSVAEVLHAEGYAPIIADPSGAVKSNDALKRSGYMLAITGADHADEQTFTLWAQLDNPTAADIATQDSCLLDNYDNRLRMNYCIDGTFVKSEDVEPPVLQNQLQELIDQVNGLSSDNG